MKKKRVFLILALLMPAGAICFVVFALANPQAAFPWPNSASYGIYGVYLLIMVFFFVMAFKKTKS